LRIALVHDWLTGMRGGEKVLSLICREFPSADLYTLIFRPGRLDSHIERRRIRASWLNELPGVDRYYRYLLPLMPLTIEAFDLRAYDLVVSCSHCVAKGFRRRPDAAHLCYCFTPMRYAWDQAEQYARRLGPAGWALRASRPFLRAWDLRSAGRVDRFLANSACVAERIGRIYRREAEVLHSPIDTGFYTPTEQDREDFYLLAGALSPYKAADHAVRAFTRLGRPLKVVGTGPERSRLERMSGRNVEFLGWVSDEQLRELFRRCRALVFPGEEDFGMIPLEAMACGAPVIAYDAGGARETVIDLRDGDFARATGLRYTPQTAEGLAEAVGRFEELSGRLQPQAAVRWAGNFSPQRFLEGFRRSVDCLLRSKGLG
jgi:glycosyltransferase involved in cell wall biosynthesis